MQATEGSIGRVFILRLEDGDDLKSSIETFAREHGIQLGYVNFIGGLTGGELMTGPKSAQARPVEPNIRALDGTHDSAAVGLIAPNETGQPELHLHGTLGKLNESASGCLRAGFKTWLTGEAVLYEILGAHCQRIFDKTVGTTLLQAVDGDKIAVARVQQTRETVVVKKTDDNHASVLHLFNAWVN